MACLDNCNFKIISSIILLLCLGLKIFVGPVITEAFDNRTSSLKEVDLYDDVVIVTEIFSENEIISSTNIIDNIEKEYSIL
ncbi:hypothetical protein U3516DRAFT_755711 [Neocallimastix sp. 'constans']